MIYIHIFVLFYISAFHSFKRCTFLVLFNIYLFYYNLYRSLRCWGDSLWQHSYFYFHPSGQNAAFYSMRIKTEVKTVLEFRLNFHITRDRMLLSYKKYKYLCCMLVLEKSLFKTVNYHAWSSTLALITKNNFLFIMYFYKHTVNISNVYI